MSQKFVRGFRNSTKPEPVKAPVSGDDNLTIAGDWTDCGVNTGCVEAAVISGRLAAHAIAKSPELADIIGYDHP